MCVCLNWCVHVKIAGVLLREEHQGQNLPLKPSSRRPHTEKEWPGETLRIGSFWLLPIPISSCTNVRHTSSFCFQSRKSMFGHWNHVSTPSEPRIYLDPSVQARGEVLKMCFPPPAVGIFFTPCLKHREITSLSFRDQMRHLSHAPLLPPLHLRAKSGNELWNLCLNKPC